MHLMYCDSCHEYTLKKRCTRCERPARNAHPARFSPDDKFSRQRLVIKRRFGLLRSGALSASPADLPAAATSSAGGSGAVASAGGSKPSKKRSRTAE